MSPRRPVPWAVAQVALLLCAFIVALCLGVLGCDDWQNRSHDTPRVVPSLESTTPRPLLATEQPGRHTTSGE